MASTPFLAVIERPEPTYAYRFGDAMADARGNTTHDLSIERDWPYNGTNNTLTLWKSGCLLDDGSYNCTAACKDTDPEIGPQMVWNSRGNMATLQNCLIYPMLSKAAENDWLEDPHGLLEKYNIVRNASNANKSQSEPLEVSDWPVINKCMHTMCRLVYEDDGHECELWGRYRTNFTVDGGNAPYLSLFTNADFCSMGHKSLNADIGGPGVLISYVQQLSLVLLAWLIVFCTKRTYEICFTNMRRAPRKCMRFMRLMRPTPTPISTEIDKPPVSPRLHTALMTALYDFQRTQIFFSVTLQVTSLIALYDTTWLDAVTVPELKTGIIMFEIISSMGIFPLALNLITLSRDKGRPELLISVATLVSMLLAGGTYLRIVSGNWTPGKLRQSGFDPEECGGLNPLQYCIGADALEGLDEVLDRSSGELLVRTIAAVVLLFCLIPGALILVVEMVLRVCHHPIYDRWHTRLREVRDRILLRVSPLMELVLLSANCSTLSALYKLRNQIPRAEWSLGQCLAVAIWAPFMVDF